MKEMQTKELEHIYKEGQNTANWLYWKLNVFLKVFCDYGTNPVKAIICSLWTILFFAFFYFFSYSNWDGINRAFLIRKHRKIIEYFRSKQQLSDFYSEKTRIANITYDNYKRELEESKIEVPYFINLLGKPLFGLSQIRYKFMSWIYQRFEILSGRWIDLKPAQKLITGSKVFVALVFYILYLIGLRTLNSLILSINAFSTLGFGNIPVKSAIRYFTIIEGFIGWFLLSIFSVSLISQILQI